MSNNEIPFNINILNLTDDKLTGMKPVRSQDIFDGATRNFHEDGIYSTSIFGKVGDERRNRRFSYIDIKLGILHPVVYRALIKIKGLYQGIINGTEFVLWNNEIKDFEKTNALSGKTGYSYFLDHWKDINFIENDSDRRQFNIDICKRFANKAILTKITVIPAGVRDLQDNGGGRTEEDEINVLYRKLLSFANSVPATAIETNPEILNKARVGLQRTYNEIYELIESFVEGKKKLITGGWAARKVFNGTRNVLTAMNFNSGDMGSPTNVGFNDTVVGLYQFLKGTLPVSKYNLRNGFLSKVFSGPNSPVYLTNIKTRKREAVRINSKLRDIWDSAEGIEKVITSFQETSFRSNPVIIEGYYIGLVYKGPDGTYKLFQDIEELPKTRSVDDVHPITFTELLYLSVYKTANKYPAFVTRYPITGYGSIYPSKVFLKPTIKTEIRTELDDNWQPMDDSNTAYQFPITGSSFVDSMAPHSTHLSRLGADYDGDTGSLNIAYTDDAVAEIDNYLKDKSYYIGTDGSISFSANTDTITYVLHNMTTNVEQPQE
jgi:hypothetical protein